MTVNPHDARRIAAAKALMWEAADADEQGAWLSKADEAFVELQEAAARPAVAPSASERTPLWTSPVTATEVPATDDSGREAVCDCGRDPAHQADLIEHELGEDCICGPTAEPVKRDDGSVGWVHVHHSLDNREATEMTETTTRTVTVEYDGAGRVSREVTVTVVEAGTAEMTTTSRERLARFLSEQRDLGRDDTYELWADTKRPEHVITIGDLRALVREVTE